jgi:hypothetical protein
METAKQRSERWRQRPFAIRPSPSARLVRAGVTRIFRSSLPGLTRQSMRQRRSFSFAAWLVKLHFSMDHRVKPGGDDAREHSVNAK